MSPKLALKQSAGSIWVVEKAMELIKVRITEFQSIQDSTRVRHR